MNPAHFQYHDLTQFPLVYARHGNAPKGYAEQWVREMELLVTSEVPYVMVMADMEADIDHEDRKQMVRWQTENMARIRQQCRGFVAIYGDPDALARADRQAEKMSRAFDMPFAAVMGAAQARDTALRLLRGGVVGTRLR